jgi:hypothetical protein
MLLERNRKGANVFLLVDRAAAVDREAMKTGSSDLASSYYAAEAHLSLSCH